MWKRIKRAIRIARRNSKALTECRRIFGELPPEIERLLNNEEGEKDHGYTCTI